MLVLADQPTEDVLAVVLADQPDVHDELTAAWTHAWEAVDPIALELCRLRIAMLLGSAAELQARTPAAVDAVLDEAAVAVLSSWPTSPRFGARERACLAFAEQFVIDVAALDDVTVAAVRDHLGDQGLVDFTSALLVVEQRQRLRLTWERLFGEPR